MEAYNKKEINQMLDSPLVIHWWNFRSKTLSFDGSVREYLKQNNVKIKATEIDRGTYKSLSIKVSFTYGSLDKISYVANDMDNAVRMVLNIQLSYLGDKSQYSFNNRTRTINH